MTVDRYEISPSGKLADLNLERSAWLGGSNYGPWVPVTEAGGTAYTAYGKYGVLSSENHPGPPYLEGGPFSVRYYEVVRKPSGQSTSWTQPQRLGTASYKYRAKPSGKRLPSIGLTHPLVLTPAILKAGYSAMSIPSVDLEPYGALAIDRSSPLNPGVKVLQAVGELAIDGLPRIISTLHERARKAKAAGNAYLSYEFGWKPLLSDLQDLYKTWHSLNSRMAQIIRDNNKGVRRRGTLRDVRTVTSSSSGAQTLAPAFTYESNISPTQGGQTVTTTTIHEKIWYSLRFRYFIPDPTSDKWTRKAKRALFGLNPTPSLIYEVMPWTWLIDWASNVGSVIKNSSSNGIADLTLDYGYVMRTYEKIVEKTFIPVGREVVYYTNKQRTLRRSSATERISSVSKERIVASPFGFGFTLADLSDRQRAILASLQLTMS